MKKTIFSLLLALPLLSHAGAISSGVGAYVGASMAQKSSSGSSCTTSYPARKSSHYTMTCYVNRSGMCYHDGRYMTPAQFVKAIGYDIIYDFYPVIVSNDGTIEVYYIMEVSN